MSIRAEVRALRPRATVRARFQRVLDRSSRILLASIGAAAAWWLARYGLDHPAPFFAPVTVVVTLGLTYGQRLRRIAELVVGVAVGVLVGDLFVLTFGTGVWQISVAASIAMFIATFLGAGPLLTVQAGVQAIIITTLVADADAALSRWLDAVVGGVIALLLATLVPSSPLHRPRREVSELVDEVAEILRDCVHAVRERDEVAAERALHRARSTETAVTQLREDAKAALEVAAISPFHLRRRPDLRTVSATVTPLDRCIRNLRVLARRSGVAVRSDEPVPGAYLDFLTHLADAATALSEDLGQRGSGESLRAPLAAVAAEGAARAEDASLSAELMRAQMRSMCLDLLMVTGLGYQQARELIIAADAAPRDR
ncbi:aromatic acid exporter family protein [Marihabitans asiaticum]|uniref:Uncharacterized membrane protein YgaE (UPF0421/DUF939 family) n=1 Tax=Marihabitans asiaticum TaxID=415218 RepID=A0A560WB57_9MICO|nr:FUSC family protein [Marihabitans asiaticum]TWD14715.1 uncharacterized membrane protein YgaE (UPF0421/DUF939 family) [Marihabitans asiaticum]